MNRTVTDLNSIVSLEFILLCKTITSQEDLDLINYLGAVSSQGITRTLPNSQQIKCQHCRFSVSENN